MGSSLSFPTVELPRDRVVLITGGNTGIGYETAKQLAMMGAHVIIACRSDERAKAAIDKMKQEYQDLKKEGKTTLAQLDELNVESMRVDLSSLRSTMEFIEQYKASARPLHLLICNAGIGFTPKNYTDDGYESMFQVNYLSQFLLTAHLLPVIKRSGEDCRIVLVSSMAHKIGSFNLNTAQAKEVRSFNRAKYYGNSKMYQIMQMYSMARRLQGTNVTISSLHPGVVDTELPRNFQDRFYYKHIYTIGKAIRYVRDVYKGSVTTLNCAVNPALKGVSGVYYDTAKPTTPSGEARSTNKQEQLWTYTLDCLKDYLPPDILQGLEGSSQGSK